MGLFKKEKKELEPQYYSSSLNTLLLNYNTYIMSKKEKFLYGIGSFFAGGLLGLIFYGGQFKNSDGENTLATYICNLVIFCLVGIIARKVFIPLRKKQLEAKRKKQLTMQFRSFLDSLAVSLSSGMNVSDSLISASNDLKNEFSEDSYIVNEVNEMINGIENNIPIEETIAFLGERSQISEIKNFGTVFSISYRAGGNLKDIVRRTNDIIGEKIEISNEIDTTLASNKTQFNAMMVIPIVMVLLLKFMSSSFSESFATIPGVIAVSIANVIFFISYKIGQKIMDIKG